MGDDDIDGSRNDPDGSDVRTKEPLCDVFSPQRKTMLASARHFVRRCICGSQSDKRTLCVSERKAGGHPSRHRGTIEYEGKKSEYIKQKEEDFYFVSVKCPHLGCQLSWNQAEKKLGLSMPWLTV